jgi:glycosyltransferase involved in cell wall biosynthesis
MKIGFDVSQTGAYKAGCGYFADSLIRAVAEVDSENHYLLYPTFGDHVWDPQASEIKSVQQHNFCLGLSHTAHREAQQFWREPPSDYEAQLGQPDIIHANNFFCPRRQSQKIKHIYTLYDLSFMQHPEWTTEANRLGCFNGVFNASLSADFMIAISEYTRRHFLEMFPHYPADRIAVAYPASRFSNIQPSMPSARLEIFPQDQFWLMVGTIEPRKNHIRLLQAYAQLKKVQGQHVMPLVLAGGQGWMMQDFEQEIDRLGLREDVHLLGYVDDIELLWLYQNCFCLVYPTLFEGFGLPVLEAMSQGAAVITSSTSSLPEIVGSAGILIDPYDPQMLFQAMHQVAAQPTSQHAELKKQAVERAKLFSWEATARQVVEIYKQVMR